MGEISASQTIQCQTEARGIQEMLKNGKPITVLKLNSSLERNRTKITNTIKEPFRTKTCCSILIFLIY